MSPVRQRAKSLQWESDLGLQYNRRPIFSPTANERLLREDWAPEFGIGNPYERWMARDMDEDDEPLAKLRSKSSDGRILNDMQAPKRTESPPRPNTEPLRRPIVPFCILCKGINIDTISYKQGYRHSSMGDLRISAKSCPLCRLLTTAPRKKGWMSRLPDRYQLYVSLEAVERCPVSHAQKPEFRRTFLRLDMVDSEENESRNQDDPSRISVAELACFTMEHDPAADAGVHWVRKLGTNTASESSFRIAQEWLEQCITSDDNMKMPFVVLVNPSSKTLPEAHEDHVWSETDIRLNTAVERLPAETPKRLIDLASNKFEAHKVQLIETHGLAFRYATLSYCWGFPHEGDWLTMRSNVTERADALETGSMPKTVRDSLLIAFKLNIRYIWIDALCIVQDDSDDWAIESAKMAGIYQGSILTIAASSSSSASQGCFNSKSESHFRMPYRVVEATSTLEDGRESSIYIYKRRKGARQDLYETEVSQGPWALRGWTYQEQALARRILYYTDSQLLWECEHCRLTEDRFGAMVTRPPVSITKLEKPIRGQMLLKKWYRGVVMEYSRRKLTYESDKLVALSALARATYLNKHVEYFAGIWKDSVLTGLLWYRRGEGRRAKDSRCPSWSWASQNSALSYALTNERENPWYPNSMIVSRRNRRDSEAYSECSSAESTGVHHDETTGVTRRRYPIAKVVDIHVEKKSLNPYGTVSGGYVVIETRMTAAWVLRDGFGVTDPMIAPGGTSFNRWKDAGRFEHQVAQAVVFAIPSRSRPGQGLTHMDDDDNNIKGRVACALLAMRDDNMIFMLLEKVSERIDTYRRVGMAVVPIDELLGLRLDSATITIV
jgi:hypothetical protein